MSTTRKSKVATPKAKTKAITKHKATTGDAKADGPKALSGLDAAALVLSESRTAMNVQDLVASMLERGLWKTEGKTPAATIYAAMIREINTKGLNSRFKKIDRGQFTAIANG